MSKSILKALLLSLMISCVITENIRAQDKQDTYNTENESLDVKVVGPPSPIVAPSENQRAMYSYSLGSRLLRENKLEEAEKYLKEAIDLDPLFVDAMDHLGMVYRRQNRLPEAEEIYLRSIEINKENKVPYLNLAVVYRLQDRLGDAFRLYRILIQLNQDDPEGYYGIGEIFYIVGDDGNAMSFFDTAIELYKNLNSRYIYDAYFYKGMIYYRMNEYDEALSYLEEARKGNPNNATIRNTINEIKRKRN